jgi:hypothetical protein
MSCLPIATQAEAEAGAVNDKTMTPLRTKQAIEVIGVSQDALASPAGGAMVGYKADAAAVPSTMASRLQREIWVEDYITDPSLAVDNYPAFAAAIAQAQARGVSTVRLNGRYRTESTIVMPSGINLVGGGHHYIYEHGVGNIFEGAWIAYRGNPSNPAIRYGSVQDCEFRGLGIDCGEPSDGRTAISIGSDNNPSTKELLFEKFTIMGAGVGVRWGDANAATPLEQCDSTTFREGTMHSCIDGFIVNAMNAADNSLIERIGLWQIQGVAFKFPGFGFSPVRHCAAGLVYATSKMFEISGAGPDAWVIEGCQSEGDVNAKFLTINGNNDERVLHLRNNQINQKIEVSGIQRVYATANYLNHLVALDGYVRWTGEANAWMGPLETTQMTLANGARATERLQRDADGQMGRWLTKGMRIEQELVAGGYEYSGCVTSGIAGFTFIPNSPDYYPGFYVIPSTPNGYAYRCTAASGLAGAEPSWPTTVGASVTTGAVTFQCRGAAAVLKGIGAIQT